MRAEPASDLVASCISFVTNSGSSLVSIECHPEVESALSDLMESGVEFEGITIAKLRSEDDELSRLCELIRRDRNVTSLVFGPRDSWDMKLTHWYISGALRNNALLSSVTFRDVRFSLDQLCLIMDALTTSSLTYIDFELCDFDKDSSKPLSKLSQIRTLKEIRFKRYGGYHTEEEIVHALPKALPELINLRSIWIQGYDINKLEGKQLGLAFSKCRCLLVELYLSEDRLEDDSIIDIISGITKLYSQNGALELLNLSKNLIKDAGGMKIAELVSHNPRLSHLDISENGIGQDAGKALGKALFQNCLTDLNASGCSLGPEGTQAICRELRLIRVLNLSVNYVGDVGAKAVAKLLSSSTTILSLSLAGNQISKSGAKTLAGGLAVNSSLQALVMDENFICVEGVDAILSALPPCHPLRELCLSSCQLGDDGAMSVARFILTREEKGAIVKLCVEDNGIKFHGIKEIIDAISEKGCQVLNLARNQEDFKITRYVAEKLIRGKGTVEGLNTLHISAGQKGAADIADAIPMRAHDNTLKKLTVTYVGRSTKERYQLTSAERKGELDLEVIAKH